MLLETNNAEIESGFITIDIDMVENGKDGNKMAEMPDDECDGITRMLHAPNDLLAEDFDSNLSDTAHLHGSSALDAHTSLQSAKDRAQMTASISMSIVHVVLLKELLDAGDRGNRYFYAGLTLISTGLTLQIICGFLSLYIAFLLRYFRKYKKHVMGACCDILFPWTCKKTIQNNNIDIDKLTKRFLQPSNSSSRSNNHCEFQTCDVPTNGCLGCYSYQCVDKHLEFQGHNTIELQEKLAHALWVMTMELEECEGKLETLIRDNESASNSARGSASSDESTENSAENDSSKNAIRNELIDAIEAKKRDMTRIEKFLEHLEDLHGESVMKQAEFWQNCMNVLLYIIFVINAFIAAFGFAGQALSNDLGNQRAFLQQPPLSVEHA